MSEREGHQQPFAKLQRFLTPRPQPQPGERCEFCGAEVPDDHSHVVNVETRGLLCACHFCHLLFIPEGAAQGRYKAVPQRYLSIPSSVFSEAQWDELQIPVGIAFFFFNTSLGRIVAFYPSPAGAMESLLPLQTWDAAVQAHPLLTSLVPDVEALLVYKKDAGCESYVVPIDACYELVGRIRRHWKGFDGGEAAWQEINAFFAGLRARSGGEESHLTSNCT